MARNKRPTGDDATNARKRYYRAAQRHLKRANELSGVSASRERKLAEIQFNHALDTYDPETTQRMSKPMRELANEFGVDVEQRRRDLKMMSENGREARVRELKERREMMISEEESSKVTESSLKDSSKRSKYEAETIYSNQGIMSRILAGTVDIWREKVRKKENGKLDTSRIMPALYEEYGIEYRKMDKPSAFRKLLEKMESIAGDILYAAKSDEAYEMTKITLQFANAMRRNM